MGHSGVPTGKVTERRTYLAICSLCSPTGSESFELCGREPPPVPEDKRVSESTPHSGERPLHQKSICLTKLTVRPYVVQIWSRYARDFDRTKPSYSTVRMRAPLQDAAGGCAARVFTLACFHYTLIKGPTQDAGRGKGRRTLGHFRGMTGPAAAVAVLAPSPPISTMS